MVRGIKCSAFVMLVLGIFFVGHPCAQDAAKLVEVNGDRLSVQADGIPLGELLIAIEGLTGVHFGFDELMAKRETFVDFKDLAISEGIRKIVSPLSCAMIYDDTDKLLKVVILGRGKDFSMGLPREIENRASEGHHSGPPNAVLSTPRGGPDFSTRSKANPSATGPPQFHGNPADKGKAEDGPPVQQGYAVEGPPLNKPYSVDGPPKAQNGELTGSPGAGSTDPSPPPASGDFPVDGPPLDWKYEMDGPPGWKN